MTSPSTRQSDPGPFARVLLAANIFSAAYMDYFAYRNLGYNTPGFWTDRLEGTAPAPDQYRIGIVWLAHLLTAHLHLKLAMAVTSIDTVSGLLAVFLLFRVLERSATYIEAPTPARWFGASTFVLLTLWSLAWLLYLQKPETLPAAMLVAVLLWLWQPSPHASRWLWKALLAVALTLLLATFRADVACMLNLGILVFLLMHRRAPATFPRPAAIAISLICVLIAGGVQLYLARVLYPHATYGAVKLWQLRPNLVHATRWPPFFLFLLPVFWTTMEFIRTKYDRDAASSAFLTGAILFSVLWITIGKIDEVRIFIPFALALVPLTTQLAVLRVTSVSPPT